MYSLVLLMAVTGSAETPDFGHRSCGCAAPVVTCGCYVSCGCYAPVATCGCRVRAHRCGCSTPVYTCGCYTPVTTCGCYTPVITCGCYTPVTTSCCSPVTISAPSAAMAPEPVGPPKK